MKRNVLFVCSANLLRSPTAEQVFNKEPLLEVRSAGLDEKAVVPMTAELLEWADIVFVMENMHRNEIRKKFKEIYNEKCIICLSIPDEYDCMDPELVEVLKERVTPFIQGLVKLG